MSIPCPIKQSFPVLPVTGFNRKSWDVVEVDSEYVRLTFLANLRFNTGAFCSFHTYFLSLHRSGRGSTILIYCGLSPPLVHFPYLFNDPKRHSPVVPSTRWMRLFPGHPRHLLSVLSRGDGGPVAYEDVCNFITAGYELALSPEGFPPLSRRLTLGFCMCCSLFPVYEPKYELCLRSFPTLCRSFPMQFHTSQHPRVSIFLFFFSVQKTFSPVRLVPPPSDFTRPLLLPQRHGPSDDCASRVCALRNNVNV